MQLDSKSLDTPIRQMTEEEERDAARYVERYARTHAFDATTTQDLLAALGLACNSGVLSTTQELEHA